MACDKLVSVCQIQLFHRNYNYAIKVGSVERKRNFNCTCSNGRCERLCSIGRHTVYKENSTICAIRILDVQCAFYRIRYTWRQSGIINDIVDSSVLDRVYRVISIRSVICQSMNCRIPRRCRCIFNLNSLIFITKIRVGRTDCCFKFKLFEYNQASAVKLACINSKLHLYSSIFARWFEFDRLCRECLFVLTVFDQMDRAG